MRNFVVIALLAVVFLACTAEAKVKLDKIQAAAGIDLAAAVRARAHAETEMVHAEATKTGMLYFNAPSIPKDANFFHPGLKYHRGRINAHEGSRSYTYNHDAGSGGKSFLHLDNKAQTIQQGATFSACANLQVNWGILMVSGAILGSVDIREQVDTDKLNVTLIGKISLGVGFNLGVASLGGFMEGSIQSTYIFPDKKFKNSPSWLIVQSLRALVNDAFGAQISSNDQNDFKYTNAQMSTIRERLFPLLELGGDYASNVAIEALTQGFEGLKSVHQNFANSVCESIQKGSHIHMIGNEPDMINKIEQIVLKSWKLYFLKGWKPTGSFNPLSGAYDANALFTQNPNCLDIITFVDKNIDKLPREEQDAAAKKQRWENAARAMICYYFVYAGPSKGKLAGETPWLVGQGGSVANLDASIKQMYSTFLPRDERSFKSAYAYCAIDKKQQQQQRVRSMHPLLANVEDDFETLLFPGLRALVERSVNEELKKEVDKKIIVEKVQFTGRLGLSANLISSTPISNRNLCDNNELLTYTPFAYEYEVVGFDPSKPNTPRPFTYTGSKVMYDVIVPEKIFSFNIEETLPVTPGVTGIPFWDRFPQLGWPIELRFPNVSLIKMSSEFAVGAMPPWISDGAGLSALEAHAPSIEASVNNFVAAFMNQIPCGLTFEFTASGLLASLTNMFLVTTAAGTSPLVDDLVLALTPFFSSAPADEPNKHTMFTQMKQVFKSVLAQAFHHAFAAALAAAVSAITGNLSAEISKKLAFEFELKPSIANVANSLNLYNLCAPKDFPAVPWTNKPDYSLAVKSFTEVKAAFTLPASATAGTGISLQGDLNLSTGTDVTFKR